MASSRERLSGDAGTSERAAWPWIPATGPVPPAGQEATPEGKKKKRGRKTSKRNLLERLGGSDFRFVYQIRNDASPEAEAHASRSSLWIACSVPEKKERKERGDHEVEERKTLPLLNEIKAVLLQRKIPDASNLHVEGAHCQGASAVLLLQQQRGQIIVVIMLPVA